MIPRQRARCTGSRRGQRRGLRGTRPVASNGCGVHHTREGRHGKRRVPRRRGGLLAGAVVGTLLAALAIVALRVDAIRLRYQLAEAVREEKALAARQRELTAAVRRLRDPVRLARLAQERGFSRPGRLIELPPVGAATPGAR